uniref:Importin subunit alpha n=1 Tax=viral metagenome TaxID=1070528 RepID=A0A6C0BLI5_9ZZZZ
MKGEKSFLSTCQRILAAEQKKLKKTKLLELPYIKRNLEKHHAVLCQQSRRATRDIVQALQFFYCLITTKPDTGRGDHAGQVLTRYELISKIADLARRHYTVTAAHPVGKLGDNAEVVAEATLFLTTVTTLDCNPHRHDGVANDGQEQVNTCSKSLVHFEARARPDGRFDREIFACYMDMLRIYLHPEGPDDGSHGAPMIPQVAMYLMWGMRNITANTSIDRPFIMSFKPVPDVIDVLHDICDHLRLQSYAVVALEQGAALLKNMFTWPNHLLACLNAPALCQKLVALVKKCWKHLPKNFILNGELMAALSLLTESSATTTTNTLIQVMLDDTEIIPALPARLVDTSGDMAMPCARLMGNLVAASRSEPTDTLLDANALTRLFTVVRTNPSKLLRKEAMWTVSNICAGTELQACRVIHYGKDHVGLKALLLTMRDDPAVSVRREAAWALLNVCKLHPKFLPVMFKFDVLPELTDFIYEALPIWGRGATNFVVNVLDFFNHFLKCPELSADQYPGRAALDRDVEKLVSFIYLFVEDARDACNEFIHCFCPARWTNIEECD